MSPHGIRNLSFYEAKSKAEDYFTVMARTQHVRPALLRLFRDSQLKPKRRGNVGSGVHVKFVLTGDLPAVCSVLGRRAFAHDFFSPFCACRKSKKQLYDLKIGNDPFEHFTKVRVASRASRFPARHAKPVA